MENLIYPAIGVRRHRLSTDGVGVTTLVASHGCTLRCKYCLNPQCLNPDAAVKKYSIESLMEKVMIDDLYFQATGGGITFGGGEPLLQAEFIRVFLQRCPKEWNISLESSLAVPLEKLLLVKEYIDAYLIDIKDMNPEIYEAYTGKKNDRVIENLRYLAEHEDVGKITIRLPLIPGYNKKEDVDFSEKILREMGFSNFDRFTYRTLKKKQVNSSE